MESAPSTCIGPEGTATRVDLVEVAGNEAFVYLEGGLVARVEAGVRPQEGSEVGVTVSREDAHLFDAASGERTGRP